MILDKKRITETELGELKKKREETELVAEVKLSKQKQTMKQGRIR